MSSIRSWVLIGLVLAGSSSVCPAPLAAEENVKTESPLDFSITPLPIQYSFIEGDAEKFRLHHWMKNGYAGGVRGSSADYTFKDGTWVAASSHAIIDQNDLSGEILVKKEDLGFVSFDYTEFRKYFDGTGGVYHLFPRLSVNELNRELELDIGHFAVECGLTLKELPELVFMYHRKYKDGTKSRLTWTAVREGGIARNIGPSFQEIDEIVDTFTIKARHKIKGFKLSGEQSWEFLRAKSRREEKQLATTGVAADTKIRVQDQKPEADLMTSTFGAERRFFNDKLWFTSGYRFAHLVNTEDENIFEFNQNRSLFNNANPKQVRNAHADTEFDTHTWVGNLMLTPWNTFAIITKFKSEFLDRRSFSLYPQDNTLGVPDGIINNTERSSNDAQTFRFGEAVMLRYTGLPRTAIYNELELEQAKIELTEDRLSLAGQSAPNAAEIFNRNTVTDVRRGIWTIGMHTSPWNLLNLTSQFRRRINNNDYDDHRESQPGATVARSAFMDEQNVKVTEFTSRATLRPYRWLQPSFRYQWRHDDYFTRVEAENGVDTEMISHIYTFDIMYEPIRHLITNTSFSRQFALTETPARLALTQNARIPPFRADVNTLLFSAEYMIKPEIILTATFEYSYSENFNDFSSFGMPFGADFDEVDVTAGVRWYVTKNFWVEPKYGFYRYDANPNAEFGDYDAHILWVEVGAGWA